MHSWHRRVINGSKERNIHQPITQNRHVVSSISSIEQEDPVNGEGGGGASEYSQPISTEKSHRPELRQD